MKREISIPRYLMSWGMILAAVFFTVVLVSVLVLSGGATRGLVRKNINTEMRQLMAVLRKEDGETDMDITYEPSEKGFSYAVISADGELLAGELPTWFGRLNVEKERMYTTHFVRQGAAHYAYRVVRHGHGDEAEFYLLGFMDLGKMDNIYRTLSYALIGGELLTLGVMLVVLFVFGRRISQTLSKVIDNAQTIGVTTDFSQRIDDDVRFRELSVLVDAHNRLLDRVEEMLAIQKEFSHNVSHELRTPISIVRAQCQMMSEAYKDNQKLRKEVGVIDRQNNRMRGLVNQLLSFSRIEYVGDYGDTEEVDLRDVIQVICEDFEELAKRDDLFALDLEQVTVQANLNLCITLFRNLISNAVKYGRSERPIDISLWREREEVVAKVRDYGMGMSEDELGRIFDAFYRTERSRSEDGFGLGLTMAKRIVEFYGGELGVESEVGRGSLFWVRWRNIAEEPTD